MGEEWTLTVDDRIATLTLHRAEHKNSLNLEAMAELREKCAQIREDRDIWAVILRTEGSQFSIGLDFSMVQLMVGADPTAVGDALRAIQTALDDVEALPQPTIAAIRGFCLGAGLLLAQACDFRISARNARFSLPEVKRGLVVALGTERITRAIGYARTKELAMLGSLIHANEAGQIGLVTHVADVAQFDAEVESFAAQFRDLPPRTVRAIKQVMDAGQHMSLRESQALEIELMTSMLNDADLAEGLTSFIEKRAPKFTGE